MAGQALPAWPLAQPLAYCETLKTEAKAETTPEREPQQDPLPWDRAPQSCCCCCCSCPKCPTPRCHSQSTMCPQEGAPQGMMCGDTAPAGEPLAEALTQPRVNSKHFHQHAQLVSSTNSTKMRGSAGPAAGPGQPLAPAWFPCAGCCHGRRSSTRPIPAPCPLGLWRHRGRQGAVAASPQLKVVKEGGVMQSPTQSEHGAEPTLPPPARSAVSVLKRLQTPAQAAGVRAGKGTGL